MFGDRRYSYTELDAEVDRVAGVLAAHGIAKGDRLVLIATNSDRFVVAFYAAHRLGAIFVPINPESAAPELDYLTRDSGAAALVFDAAVITGGRNVYSIEVENAVAAHSDILDCAVIARPHPEYGESIVAVAVLNEGAALTLDALRESCAERIASYKLPHDLVITEQIPRNPSGKILKRELRERLPNDAPVGR